MSGRSLILAVKIIGDANDAIRAMDAAAGQTDKFGSALNTAAKWSAAGLAAIGAGAKQAVDAASELEQATGAVSSVFGEYSGEMMQYAEQAADAVGLSQSEYGNTASVLGAQLKNMGLSMEETAGTTNDLIGLGADLAATFGGTTADATSALSALLRGERDPIEKYGVSIKQADIEAQKAAMGLDGLTGEAAKNADLQATLALLTNQTADAQGQFARETDSAAGSAQIASANFENAQAALGEALLPIVTEASEKLAELARWLQANAEWITPLIGVVAALAAAIVVINAAYKMFAAIQAMQTAAQLANNAAWLASPVTWIVLAVVAAVAALIAIVVLIVQHWDQIKATGVAAWNAIVSAVQTALSWLGDRISAPLNAAKSGFESLRDGAVAAFETIIDWIQTALDWLGDLASNILPGWAKDLLGISSFSMTVEPQLAAFSAPAYAADLSLTPSVTSYAAPLPPAPPAPVAHANVAAMTSLATAMLAAAVQPATGSTTYEDNRTYNISLPNYLGDREEVVEELSKEMEKAEKKKGGLIHS